MKTKYISPSEQLEQKLEKLEKLEYTDNPKRNSRFNKAEFIKSALEVRKTFHEGNSSYSKPYLCN